MILTTMIPFNIGDKVKVSEVYFLKPFWAIRSWVQLYDKV
jgi:hypothetical protein